MVQFSSPTSLLAVHLYAPALSMVRFLRVTISGFFRSVRGKKKVWIGDKSH